MTSSISNWALLKSLQSAEVFDLCQIIGNGMPVYFQHIPYSLTLNRRHEDEHHPKRNTNTSFVNEVIVSSAHVGTHIDALGHFSANMCVYGGINALDIESRDGLKSLDALEIKPICCRAVVFDIAALYGVNTLDESQEVTVSDVKKCMQLQGIENIVDTAVFFRTGWDILWNDRNSLAGMSAKTPGPSRRTIEWLVDCGAILFGADTPSFECIPSINGSVHALLLVEKGIHIIENLNLQHICNSKIYDFTVLGLPLPLRGASGSPLRIYAFA